MTCTEEELGRRPGDCWIKLSPWEKQLFVSAFQDGWAHSCEFAERQEYEWGGNRSVKLYHI